MDFASEPALPTGMYCVCLPLLVLFVGLFVLMMALALATGLTGISAFTFQMRFYRHSENDDLTIRKMVWLNLTELRAAVKLGWWHLRALVARHDVPASRDGAQRVLLVHGYTQNSTNMYGLQRMLSAMGCSTRRVFLGFAWPWRRVEGYGVALAAELAEAEEPVWVVAHSMGGLVLREVLTEHPDLRARVIGVVTLGSPHFGTAVHPRIVQFVKPADQMAYQADWVTRLPTLPELLPGANIHTIGSRGDMVVYPESTTRQPGARHHTLDDIGHAALLTDERSLALVADAVLG